MIALIRNNNILYFQQNYNVLELSLYFKNQHNSYVSLPEIETNLQINDTISMVKVIEKNKQNKIGNLSEPYFKNGKVFIDWIYEKDNNPIDNPPILKDYQEILKSEVINNEVNYTITDKEINNYKKYLNTIIDNNAEIKRLEYITPGIAQSMVYQAKSDEAERFIKDPSGDYKLLTAEIGITGSTLKLVAEEILNTRKNWIIIASNIENIRLKAKKDIENALTVKESYEIFKLVSF